MKPEIIVDTFERREALPNGGMWVRWWEVKIRFPERDVAYAMKKRIADFLQGEVKQKALEGVIEIKPVGYHSLQLVFRTQADIENFKAAHGIKGDA